MQRNPKITIEGKTFQIIGDPHMGRHFANASPAVRLMLKQKQTDRLIELVNQPVDYVIVVGDLFDKAHVPEAVIIEAIEILDKPNVFLLRGNHDLSRSDLDKSSFELLEKTVLAPRMVTDEPVLLCGGKVALCGWSFKRSLIEILGDHRPETVVCHLDRHSYGGDDSNVIPFAELEDLGVKTVINGHEHTPYSGYYGKVFYLGSGSLLPYTFAEDPEGELFVTLTKEQIAQDPESLSNKFVRVLGDDLSGMEDLPCLGLQLKRQAVEVSAEDLVIDSTDYSTLSILTQIGQSKGMSMAHIQSLYAQIEDSNDDS
jgi:DNA repair exonuclease SbcCD nuclease subunit